MSATGTEGEGIALTPVIPHVSNLHCGVKTPLAYNCSPLYLPFISPSISPNEALVGLTLCWLLLKGLELTLLSTR